ncbi:MAG: type II methionyl aminopeptidase, partial [Thermoproteota archaeon]
MAGSDVETYVRLGGALRDLLDWAVSLVKPGVSVLEIAERVETRALESGFELAFPVNISVGGVAAHYTPPPGDELVLPERGLVKLDAGLMAEGLIVDAARTVDLGGDLSRLVEASREALEAARLALGPGVRVRDVSSAIYEAIRSRGFKPIANLSGHKIERYRLHAGVDVPSVPHVLGMYRFSPGDVFAIEPFVTTARGRGYVKEAPPAFIFSFRKRVRTRDPAERVVLRSARERYRGLPFCERWIVRDYGMRVGYAMERLARKGALTAYPPLVEAAGEQVAQWEDTFLITEDGVL